MHSAIHIPVDPSAPLHWVLGPSWANHSDLSASATSAGSTASVLPQDLKPRNAPQAPSGGAAGEGGTAPAGGTAPGMCPDMDSTSLLLMALMFGVLYFFMIRPARNQEKQRQSMLGALKKGDRVVTSGGMHAVVTGLDDSTVQIEVDTVRMTMDRTAITRVVNPVAATPKPEALKP